MTKRTVTLTPEQAAFADQLVADGLFSDRDAVIEAAFARLRKARARYDRDAEALREALRPGIEDADAGRFSDRTIEEIAEDAIRRVEEARRRV